MTQIELFDEKSIDSIIWPQTKQGDYAKNYLEPLIKEGIFRYFKNICADLYLLKANELILPILATAENYENSWVCSPYGQYISYAKISTHIIGNKALEFAAKNFINGLGKVCRYGKVNSVVYINNWLFSTDLYPQNFLPDELEHVHKYLKIRFPHHAIILRSLNQKTNDHLIHAAKKLGFQMILSRYVHFTDPKEETLYKTRIIKSDLKLFRETDYEILDKTQIKPTDYPKLLELYNILYVNQHSHLSPQPNDRFIKMAIEKELFYFIILKKEEEFKGVAGFFERDGVMHCPFFGYDKQDPEQNVIYRLLNTALLLKAKEKGLLFNQSAGASFYKNIRRAVGYLEYMAVYSSHLPIRQRVGWATLKTFINCAAGPYIKKY